MISTQEYKELQEKVRASYMDQKFLAENSVQIATMTGPCLVIEMIVKEASINSGTKMDWCYAGGRAEIMALGNKKQIQKAKDELFLCQTQMLIAQ